MNTEKTEVVSDKDVQCCIHCGDTPCIWEMIGEEVISEVKESNTEEKTLSRKLAYRIFTLKRFGTVGKHNRVQVPNCALVAIREEWPDEKGHYMGFCEH